jgi:hypothetical protein
VFKKISKVGGCGSFGLRGSMMAQGERRRVFRVRVFVFFFTCVKLLFLLSLLRGPVFIGKNVVKFSNLISQLFSFCKFDFF